LIGRPEAGRAWGCIRKVIGLEIKRVWNGNEDCGCHVLEGVGWWAMSDGRWIFMYGGRNDIDGSKATTLEVAMI
jgi:hypothetical protein